MICHVSASTHPISAYHCINDRNNGLLSFSLSLHELRNEYQAWPAPRHMLCTASQRVAVTTSVTCIRELEVRDFDQLKSISTTTVLPMKVVDTYMWTEDFIASWPRG